MHVDFLSLACLRDALAALADAKIQQVRITDERSVALELYAGFRTTLLLDSHPNHARALLSEAKARRGVDKESPLSLLLRKYVRGGRLRAVRQPAWERVLLLDIENEEGRSTLVAEIMGRFSNLLLLDEAGTVRAALRHASPSQNEARTLLPNHPYEPPPPQLKAAPPQLDSVGWAALLAQADTAEPLARTLVRRLAATSPTLARELVARATGEAESVPGEVDPEALRDAAQELFAPLGTGQWQPHVARDEEGTVVAFAPYELSQFERSEPTATLSEGIAAFFVARLEGDGYAAARRRVGALLAEAQDRVRGTQHQLRSQWVEPREVERLREDGELLLAYQWQVPRGAEVAELPDFEGNPRRIPLDPTMSVVENAQRLFSRYEKKKRAADEVPPRLEAAEQDLAFLASLEGDLQQAEERPEIDAVREALAEAGLVPRPKRQRGGAMPVRGPRRITLGEWGVLVGRNAKQNDEVTFRHAASDDLWLHARGLPGSHVILRSAGREPPAAIIEQAAQIAAYYSQARGHREAAVDVTERRHVRRISGARPGLVSYRHERTLHVRPAPAEELDE